MRYFLALGIFMIITGISCDTGVKNKKQEEQKKNASIRNGIKIKLKGVKVEKAYLVFDENGNDVPEGNNIALNQKVKLVLESSGWTEKSGKIFMSGVETIMTSEGDVLLDDKNIFSEFSEGLTLEEIKTLYLSVVITSVAKHFDFFKVSFQFKDQNNPEKVVEGDYRLHLE